MASKFSDALSSRSGEREPLPALPGGKTDLLSFTRPGRMFGFSFFGDEDRSTTRVDTRRMPVPRRGSKVAILALHGDFYYGNDSGTAPANRRCRRGWRRRSVVTYAAYMETGAPSGSGKFLFVFPFCTLGSQRRRFAREGIERTGVEDEPIGLAVSVREIYFSIPEPCTR